MAFSNKVLYGLRSLVHLARSYPRGHLTVRFIAAAESVSAKYLEGVFSVLRSRGLVHGHPGKSGGYSLAVDPESVSLVDVVNTFEPDFLVAEPEKWPEWEAAEAGLRSILSGLSLAAALRRVDQAGKGTDYAI